VADSSYVNWVLTDGALVSKSTPACASSASNPTGTLVGIDVYRNNAYTGASNPRSMQPLGSLQCPTDPTLCLSRFSNAASLPGGGAKLFFFSSPLPQPFVDVATQDVQPHLAIKLTDAGQKVPAPQVSASAPIQDFLNPTPLSVPPGTFTTPGQPERGTPIVNTEGQVVSIQLGPNTNLLPVAAAKAILQSQPGAQPANLLQTAWNHGIDDLYQKPPRSAAAATEFQAATQANPAFRAATTFMGFAVANEKGGNQGTQTGQTNPSSSYTLPILGISVPKLWVWLGAGVIVLLVVLVLGVIALSRARAHRRELALFAEQAKVADRIATTATLELQQRQPPPVVNNASMPRAPSVATLPCPHCGQSVRADASFCPSCRYLLSPSESGLHLKARPPMPADMPTLVNPAIPAQPATPDAWPTLSGSDLPTLPLPPNGQLDANRTQPYTVKRVSARNLSMAVGTRTDPGIKRKYKPNEDSLLAIQGPLANNSQLQQFGLFVVADGMGGHANGQDASRLAIQTIINYMLPALSRGDDLQDEGFMKLLADGVQQANLAVHKHNQEQRADMGTTMTAALVVGSMAYVANVGDSRTYLYREPEGLSKITRDHSVVASLVDAGVIKPDDIYTHPKRNQIYRSLGEKPVVEVDTFKVQLQPGDKLLLCSDGLWDMVRDPVIQQVMRMPIPDPTQTGEELIKAALHGGGEDNVSVIVVDVGQASEQAGVTRIQLLAKPDSVSVPNVSN